VDSNASNGLTDTIGADGVVGAALIEVGPTPTAHIRSGDFTVVSQTGQQMLSGEVSAGTNVLGADCFVGMSAMG
jgi:hypothetical protein